MIHRRLRIVFAAALIAIALPAAAAPFCTQAKGAQRICQYTEAADCIKRAGELGAVCVPNPGELRSSVGSARYCLVDNDRNASCIYPARQNCETDSIREGSGACVDNPSGTP